jgi:ferredoxin-type protein NapH
MRRSRTTKWRAAVLVTVHLLIALHITHWVVTGRSMTPVEPSEAMAFTKAGILNAGAIFFAVAILSTLLLGRLFCGWACHLVALQDLSRSLLARVGIRPRPLRSRILAWVPFVAFFYMFLWPVFYRLWVGDSFSQFSVELTTAGFWETFPGWTVGALTFLVCGFLIVYLLGAKGFCTYACPYGAIFSIADRFAPMRVRVTDACQGCAHCTATCSSNVRVHEEVRDFGMVVDADCLKCLDCVSVCPNQALYYGRGVSRRKAIAAAGSPSTRAPALKWQEEAILGGGFVAAFFSFRGLYSLVPFLLALGLSAVLAYLLLTVARLFSQPNLSLRRTRLKSRGQLLPAGYAFLTFMCILALLWIHSGLVRYHQILGEAHFRSTDRLRHQLLDITREPPVLDAAEMKSIRRSLHHLEAADRLGLIATSGNASRRAWLYFLAGSPVDLEAATEKAIDLGEYANPMHHLMALEALRAQDLDAARTRFELAIEADSSRPEPYLNYGLLEIGAGNLEAGERVFERGASATAGNVELLYNAGLAKALQGNSEGAISRFERVLQLDPKHLPARENLAGILATVGRLQESERHFRVAVAQSPRDADTRLLLARVLAASDQIAAALEQVKVALELRPGMNDAIILRDELEARRQS